MSPTSEPAVLEWAPPPLPGEVIDRLLSPQAPFHMVSEDVRGTEMTVFAHRPRSLRAMLDAAVADCHDESFLVSPAREWTYGEALADIDAVAVVLAEEYGVRAGDRVAVVAANSAEYGIVLWAVLSLGAVVTSLNGWWTGPELQTAVDLTEPVLIVGDQRRLDVVATVTLPETVACRLLDDLVAQAPARHGQRPPTADVSEDDAAVVLFTSGTTGRSKGATLSHRNIINFGMSVGLGMAFAGAMRPADAPPPRRPATILTSPMFHVSGLVGILVSGVMLRNRLVFARPGAWDPVHYLELTERYGVTQWSGVPTQFWRLLREPSFAQRDLSTLVSAGGGGAVFPPELVRVLTERLPGAALGNGYGMSETVGLGTVSGGPLFVAYPDAVGRPQPTSCVQIRDVDGTEVLAEGEVGEIVLRSPSTFLGYWNDPAATSSVLDDDGWYHTGDYGRVQDGLLYLESRRRDLILRGGENVYPIEIENRLVAHADIADAAVIGVEHQELGQDVKAFVVLEPGRELSDQDVQVWCGQALARYKVPARVEFRDALPYSATGKLLKTELERDEQTARV